MLFDTHAHLNDHAFDPDREALMAGFASAGVGLVMNAGCSLESSRDIVAMAEKYPYGDRALLDGIYVKTLKEGESPTEKGVLIVGVEAAVALFDAMVSGKPQTFRYITVCGEGMEKGGNYFLPRGITMHEVSHLCGGFPEDRLIIENSLLSGDMSRHLALDTVLLSILESTVAFLVEKGYAVCEDTYIARERLLSSISSH